MTFNYYIHKHPCTALKNKSHIKYKYFVTSQGMRIIHYKTDLSAQISILCPQYSKFDNDDIL